MHKFTLNFEMVTLLTFQVSHGESVTIDARRVEIRGQGPHRATSLQALQQTNKAFETVSVEVSLHIFQI